jgi:hypothetical protein
VMVFFQDRVSRTVCPWLALNLKPPDLYLLHSKGYSCETPAPSLFCCLRQGPAMQPRLASNSQICLPSAGITHVHHPIQHRSFKFLELSIKILNLVSKHQGQIYMIFKFQDKSFSWSMCEEQNEM